MSDPLYSLKTALAGRYRIEQEIGAGGMATVYRAHDLRHDRPVAVKVLRTDLAAVIGVDRFLAEIKTTANLQHAHILGLIDSGEVDGTVFYVMPFVDGESLRAKLTREKQIAIPEAVRIATAVAGALDYAHRRGVIHRDIKPENILLHEGQPLVADFGIALAVSRSGGGARTGSRMTESGMSLGTPQYMSPEQAAGERNLDARTDIYSLGCVLYELLTGEPPFSGPTAQAIIAKVMTVEPQPVATLRRSVPGNVAAATTTALSKVPADRFATAAEFAAALANPQYVTPEVAARRAASWLPRLTPREIGGLAALAILATIAGIGWLRPRVASSGVVRFEIPVDESLAGNQVHLSHDGTRIIWSGPGGFWDHRLDTLGTRKLREPIPQAQFRDISPDGREVLLAGRGNMTIASLSTGPSRSLTSGGGRGATWSSDGNIYSEFVSDTTRWLGRVSPDGSRVDTLAKIDRSVGVAEIVALPGGRGLVVAQSRNGVLELAAFDFGTKTWKALGAGGPQVRFVEPGYLLFARGTFIMAAPFDVRRHEFTQQPVPFAEANAEIATLEASANVLMYRAGPDALGGIGIEMRSPDATSRAPVVLPNVPDTLRFSAFAVSPDGKRFVTVSAPLPTAGNNLAVPAQSLNLYVYTLPVGPMTRLSSPLRDGYPSWIPGGRELAFVRFSTDTPYTSTLMRRVWDNNSAPTSILERGFLEGLLGPSSWLPSGRTAVIQVGGVPPGASAGGTGGGIGGGGGRGGGSGGGGGGRAAAGGGGAGRGAGGGGGRGGGGRGGDLMRFSFASPGKLDSLVATEATELNPAVSSDGRWLAYQSTSTGRSEVYVSLIDGSGRRQVSPNGGTAPKWAHNGHELFFRVGGTTPGTDTLYSAQISGATDLSVGDVRTVFTGANLAPGYGILSGDTLFVARASVASDRRNVPPLVVVLNFVQELNRLFAKK